MEGEHKGSGRMVFLEKVMRFDLKEFLFAFNRDVGEGCIWDYV